MSLQIIISSLEVCCIAQQGLIRSEYCQQFALLFMPLAKSTRREGLCMYNMHRDSLSGLDFQFKL